MTYDLDEMIAALPPNEKVLVNRLRALVAECIPLATEKSYEGLCMPFYKRNRLICYILPPSVSLEPGRAHDGKKSKGVALGFNQGKWMSNEKGELQAEGRKQVYVMYFKKLTDIDEKQVRALLFEGAMIDEEFGRKKYRGK